MHIHTDLSETLKQGIYDMSQQHISLICTDVIRVLTHVMVLCLPMPMVQGNHTNGQRVASALCEKAFRLNDVYFCRHVLNEPLDCKHQSA